MLKTEIKQAPLQAQQCRRARAAGAGKQEPAQPQKPADPGAAARGKARAWGWLPELSVTTALGLLLIAATNYGAYTSADVGDAAVLARA